MGQVLRVEEKKTLQKLKQTTTKKKKRQLKNFASHKSPFQNVCSGFPYNPLVGHIMLAELALISWRTLALMTRSKFIVLFVKILKNYFLWKLLVISGITETTKNCKCIC